MNVDAIEQRARHAGEIPLHDDRTARARVVRIAEPAARTGIHRRCQHEARWIREAHCGARDRYDAVLHRLAQHLEHVLAELGQLVQKQHAAVREADFARPRIRPAPDQPGVGDRVMRRAERPPRHERLAERQRPRDRMDLGGFERLIQTHLGEGRRQAPGKHRLPAPWRPHHQDVVSAGGRDLERALGVRLPLHLGEVHVVPGALGEQRGDIDGGARQLAPAIEEIRDFSQASCAKDLEPVHDAGLGKVLARQDQCLDARRPRSQRDGQGSPDRTNRAFQTELAEHRDLSQPFSAYLFGCRKNPERDR